MDNKKQSISKKYFFCVPAMCDLSVLQPKGLMDWPASVNLYTDATPLSVAAIVPSIYPSIQVTQASENTEEINMAEDPIIDPPS